MSGAETFAEVDRVLDKYGEWVISMVEDQGKFVAPLVELWWALSKARAEMRILKKYSDGLRARLGGGEL